MVEGLPSKPQFPSILRVQILVASALGRRKQEGQKFKAIFSHRAKLEISVGYMNSCLKKIIINVCLFA